VSDLSRPRRTAWGEIEPRREARRLDCWSGGDAGQQCDAERRARPGERAPARSAPTRELGACPPWRADGVDPGCLHRVTRGLAPISTQPIRPHPLPRHMPVSGGFAQAGGLGRCQAPALCGVISLPCSHWPPCEGLARDRRAMPGNSRDHHVRTELPSLSVKHQSARSSGHGSITSAAGGPCSDIGPCIARSAP
jgi:hypothetical protein